jgi:hypothetical protein
MQRKDQSCQLTTPLPEMGKDRELNAEADQASSAKRQLAVLDLGLSSSTKAASHSCVELDFHLHKKPEEEEMVRHLGPPMVIQQL